MASSYTTSFGIEKIGSGEQSGAWGTTTNYNLDLLDRITAYTSVALSGTTHTLTVREASPGSGTENLQDGMYRVIKFTGALGGDNTVTIAPNTTKAFFIIHNGTTDSGSSGPYSVILTQGSGANITVANGKNAVIYCDGGGSGAVVVDAVSNLALATVTASGDITSAGTVNVTGDTATGDGASMGYTSSEGLILTGQGSTNDVTIKNDADADVITIATGATNVDVVGDLTAGTLNADGDTSAGDNATIGYTSVEGLILTGQGSTSDVTLKNDADGTVFTVPTGTDDILFPDSAMAMWGAGSDMLLYHDGTNSYITNAVGALKIATETSGIAITIGHATSETTVADNLVVTGTAAAGGNLLSQVGKQTIWVPAASMYPSSTNGCADLTQVETTALRPDLKCLDFDASSDEFAQFAVAYPKSWNGGTVTYQPFWTVTGTNTGTVAWQVGGIAVSNDDSIDTAFGTLVATTALAFSGTSNDLMVSAESGAVTIAGTPAANDLCFFQINRDISADDQSGDARLLGIKVFFTTNAVNDT